jgi:hypothetical protein
MKNLSKNLGAAFVVGLLAIGTMSTAYSAENSQGVAEFLNKSEDSIKKALEELRGGRADEARVELKNVRQFTKEITGNAASMKLQKVNQSVKEALTILETEKDLKKAADVLEPAVKSMIEINAASKNQ